MVSLRSIIQAICRLALIRRSSTTTNEYACRVITLSSFWNFSTPSLPEYLWIPTNLLHLGTDESFTEVKGEADQLREWQWVGNFYVMPFVLILSHLTCSWPYFDCEEHSKYIDIHKFCKHYNFLLNLKFRLLTVITIRGHVAVRILHNFTVNFSV